MSFWNTAFVMAVVAEFVFLYNYAYFRVRITETLGRLTKGSGEEPDQDTVRKAYLSVLENDPDYTMTITSIRFAPPLARVFDGWMGWKWAYAAEKELVRELHREIKQKEKDANK